MPVKAETTPEAHIVKVPGICGGAATIRGTRMPVWVIASYVMAGYDPTDIRVHYFPSLSMAQVFAALSYWYDHQGEIEEDIERNQPPTIHARHP